MPVWNHKMAPIIAKEHHPGLALSEDIVVEQTILSEQTAC